MGELQQLPGRRRIQTGDARDAVAGGQYRTGLADFDMVVEALDLLLENLADLGRSNLHRLPFVLRTQPAKERSRRSSRVRRLPSKTRPAISTTTPPRSSGSTLASATTRLPVCRSNTSLMRRRLSSESGRALRTCARTRPRTWSSSR